MTHFKLFEFASIEPHKIDGGSQPEIAILGLGDGIDPIRGQTIISIPGLTIVLEDASGWIEGGNLECNEEKEEQKTTPGRVRSQFRVHIRALQDRASQRVIGAFRPGLNPGFQSSAMLSPLQRSRRTRTEKSEHERCQFSA
jgi:hypothetical protein